MKATKLTVLFLGIWLTNLCYGQLVDLDESNLPLILIHTGGRTIVNEPKIKATIAIVDNENGINRVTDSPVYQGFVGIEYRGSSSQALFPKKSFGFETWDEAGDEIDTTLLGFPSEQDWILHGPYSDKTMMRNKLTFDLYAFTGRYSSRTKYVELILNDQYHGVYILMEKIKRDKNRVDIATLREEDNSGDELTGGYILKLDKYDGSGGGGFSSQYAPPNSGQTIFFQYDEPQDDEITTAQKNYIRDFMNRFEYSLGANTYQDPEIGYRQYINIDSFVDFFLINELNKNIDGYRLSTFMHKDKDSNDGRLYLGPIWDFNLAFGNADYCQGGSPTGWAYQFNQICPGDTWQVPFWWERLMTDDFFRAKVKNRWNELRQGPWSEESIHALIDGYAQQLSEAQERNFTRWDKALGYWVWPNNYVGETYESEVNYLKAWLENRLNWLDREIEDLEVQVTTSVISPEAVGHPYPNPFTTLLSFPEVGQTRVRQLKIFNLAGELIRTVNKQEGPLEWDGTTDSGIPVPPSIYLYHLVSEDGRINSGKVQKTSN